MKLKTKKIFLIIFFVSLVFFIYIKVSETEKTAETSVELDQDLKSNLNIINDVKYNSNCIFFFISYNQNT